MIGDHDSEDLIKLTDRLTAEIPNARRITIKNSAHLPSLEHPSEFNGLLTDFLTHLPRTK